MKTVLCIYLIAVKLIAFIIFGVDKHKAIHHKWRIPETTLLSFAWIGGSVGAILGMTLFHHKTRKWKFRIFVPTALIVWCVVVYAANSFL